ncbi:hypothetical protein TGCAST_312190C, partial [Toxoplasma gondii CAST]
TWKFAWSVSREM